MNVKERGEFLLVHPCLPKVVWFLGQKDFFFCLANLSAATAAGPDSIWNLIVTIRLLKCCFVHRGKTYLICQFNSVKHCVRINSKMICSYKECFLGTVTMKWQFSTLSEERRGINKTSTLGFQRKVFVFKGCFPRDLRSQCLEQAEEAWEGWDVLLERNLEGTGAGHADVLKNGPGWGRSFHRNSEEREVMPLLKEGAGNQQVL